MKVTFCADRFGHFERALERLLLGRFGSGDCVFYEFMNAYPSFDFLKKVQVSQRSKRDITQPFPVADLTLAHAFALISYLQGHPSSRNACWKKSL